MNNVENFEQKQEKKLYTEIVTLPSGKVVELRGMKTQEMDILANRKAMKDGAGINDIAKNCIMNLDEFDYENALQGDRYCILVNIRRITYPGPYKFDVSCPQCEHKGSFNVDLETLPVKMLENETTNLKFKFPRSEYEITYHLPTGKDENEVLKLRKRYMNDLLSLSLMTNIDRVEGLKFKTLEWFKDLDAYDVLCYKEELEEKNCGIETSLELCCDSCGAEFETELPITTNFFLPKKQKKI